ncbi:THAP domain-containing protein 1-like [Ischnura elegans]|uniref:THAP domain-containing protein 1-like n=1 Tax=Ischnura elegans TaxID=197161 RepID=UPI001ED86857|nr:THAP domain-containing protein 1-like [Ischnura elegans]
MPNTCVVPGCKGNYRSGPKVQVFSFPKDPELHRKWLHAIRRKDFTPTKNNKVCELHFKTSDLRKETAVFDESTGREIRVPLMVPRLVEGAIPSQLPNCPSYLSAASFSRESPDSKRTRMEQTALAIAMTDSILENELHKEKKTFHSLVELKNKMQFIDSKFWSVVEYGDSLALCHIVFTPSPKVKFSLVISTSLNVTAFLEDNDIRFGCIQITSYCE